MQKILIIIPTFNERENIGKAIQKLFSLNISGLDVLVVDDNSPDGTAEKVKEMQKENKRIFLLERSGKQGLGTAYITGFKFAIEKQYDVVFEMDADLSHDPAEVPNFLAALSDADLVVGSRYLTGVNVINWPLTRLIISVMANKYTRLVTGIPISDCTSGFKCFRRTVLEAIPLNEVKSNGYSFQIEMNFKVWKRGFKIKEVPIIFHDRMVGASKMSRKIMIEAAYMVWKLKIFSFLGKY